MEHHISREKYGSGTQQLSHDYSHLISGYSANRHHDSSEGFPRPQGEAIHDLALHHPPAL